MSEAIYKVIDEKYAEILHALSEKEKMIMGLPYNPLDEQLTKDRIFVRQLYRKYNLTPPGTKSMDPLDEGDFEGADLMGVQRRELIAQILRLNDNQKNKVEFEPPFYCDYGYNIKIEGSFYANSNATILDCAEVVIGDATLFGPNVHVYAATHSVNPAERKCTLERALPVKIGRNCWIGGNTTILPGVEIGENTTIGADRKSVV